MRHSLSLVLTVLMLTGCNTMLRDSFQGITINTPGLENVECMLETDRNRYRLLAPGEVNVERAGDTMTITCEKAGYVPNVTVVESKIRMAASQLNVFNGFLGVPYDMASRSMYAYPDTITVKMVPDPGNVVPLVPSEVHVLKTKETVVTVKDVQQVKGGAAPDDKKTDKKFSETSKK